MTEERKPLTPSIASRNLRDLAPMGQHRAAELAVRLLEGYPHLSLTKPKEYMTTLVEVLQGYPFWVGEFAIRRTDAGDNANFLPSDRQMRKWCDDLIAPAVSLERWNRQVALALPPPDKPSVPDTTPEQRFHQAMALEMRARRAPGRPSPPAQSGYMARVLADIEARKRARIEA